MRAVIYLLITTALLACQTTGAQNTFIKRYKNSTLPEGSVAVCNLPENRIAIIGQQPNGFAWQSPMVVITDSAGNQLRHFVDTSCYGCDILDGCSDKDGFVYVTGCFFGKAGVAKYDTLGNKIWQREIRTTTGQASYSSVIITDNDMVVSGGYQSHDSIISSWLLLTSYDLQGNLQWVIDSNFGNTAPEANLGVLSLNKDSNWIYATGGVSDTLPQRAIYLKVSHSGTPKVYKELNNGRKLGYSIIPLSADSILIGGKGDIFFSNYFSFISLCDSMGNVLQTVQDSNYLFTVITDMAYDFKERILYALDFDTIDIQGSPTTLARISAYSLPINSLQSPLWSKTVPNTSSTASVSMGLTLSPDHKILHSSSTSINFQHYPYLLKADANTCADVAACDTNFVSDIQSVGSFNSTSKLYPNPIGSGNINYELLSDEIVKSVTVTCYDVDGGEISSTLSETNTNGYSYKAKIGLDSNTPAGIYIVQFLINGKYKLHSRIVKTE